MQDRSERWNRKPTSSELESFVEVVSESLHEGISFDELLEDPRTAWMCSLQVKTRYLIEAAKEQGHVIERIEKKKIVPVRIKRGKQWITIEQTETRNLFRYDFSEKGGLDMAKTQKKAAAKKVTKAKAKAKSMKKNGISRGRKSKEGAAPVHFPADLDLSKASAKQLIGEVRKDLEHRVKTFSGGRISFGKAVAELMISYLKAAEAKK